MQQNTTGTTGKRRKCAPWATYINKIKLINYQSLSIIAYRHATTNLKSLSLVTDVKKINIFLRMVKN